MDFKLSDEQRMLEDTVRSFIERDYDAAARRAALAAPEGFSRDIWRILADTGLLRLNVPTAQGGLDATPADAMIVCEAFGRGLLVEPFIANAVVAAQLIRLLGSSEQCEHWLSALAEGRKVFAIAVLESDGRYDLWHVGSQATALGQDWMLSGTKDFVLNGDSADTLIVTARTSGAVDDESGVTVFLVDRDSPGVSVTAFQTFDGRRLARVEFKDVRVTGDRVLGPVGKGFLALERAVDRGLAALCAESVGAMQALLDLTVEHLRTRAQFGKPIGTFQALQHRAADMLASLEQARSMAFAAAAHVDAEDRRLRRRTISAAKWAIGRCGREMGQAATQLHGGMGMTDEGLSGQYFKRLMAIDRLWGDSEHHAELFASHL